MLAHTSGQDCPGERLNMAYRYLSGCCMYARFPVVFHVNPHFLNRGCGYIASYAIKVLEAVCQPVRRKDGTPYCWLAVGWRVDDCADSVTGITACGGSDIGRAGLASPLGCAGELVVVVGSLAGRLPLCPSRKRTCSPSTLATYSLPSTVTAPTYRLSPLQRFAKRADAVLQHLYADAQVCHWVECDRLPPKSSYLSV